MAPWGADRAGSKVCEYSAEVKRTPFPNPAMQEPFWATDRCLLLLMFVVVERVPGRKSKATGPWGTDAYELFAQNSCLRRASTLLCTVQGVTGPPGFCRSCHACGFCRSWLLEPSASAKADLKGTQHSTGSTSPSVHEGGPGNQQSLPPQKTCNASYSHVVPCWNRSGPRSCDSSSSG